MTSVVSCYDHAEERTWRHLNTCQFQTLVHARIPRVKCPEHRVLQVAVPLAREKIVFERFHIMQHMTKAVDTVRKREHRGLLQHGDERLKRTKYLELSSEPNMHVSRGPFFEQLEASDLKTARAWGIKENFRNLWSYTTPA